MAEASRRSSVPAFRRRTHTMRNSAEGEWMGMKVCAFELVLVAALVCSVIPALAQDAAINVHPGQVLIKRLSRFMTGACLEDVNHEVYGGIYTQMIFGESFQEPPTNANIEGFKAYGGTWSLENGSLVGSGEMGPKLVSELLDLADGEIGVKVMIPDGAGNAGLIVKVNDAGMGADNFHGYEVSLDADRQVLVFGRHSNNWEHITDVPCRVPANQWIDLIVKMHGTSIEAFVDGKSVITHQEDALRRSGTFGLRPWNQKASYKDLWIRRNGETTSVAFKQSPGGSGPVSGMWQPLRRGTASGRMEIDAADPWVGQQSQRIEFTGGQGEIGVENMGLNRWGMYFAKGKVYEGSLRVRVTKPTTFYVAMESADGSKSYAEARVSANPSGWQKIPFKLTPDATDNRGRFAIKLKEPGAVSVGYAFLQPGQWGRFKGLASRKDVVDGLIRQGITVLRYGGYMINSPEYRWKKMIGPRDERPTYKGSWYPQSTNGWGISDFLATCQAAGFLAIPDMNMDETPQDMADFIEYVNGPADSTWGKRRVEDGHPKPFGVKIIELGNEEHVNEDYWQKFRPMAEAMWAKDPEVILVVGDLVYSQPIVDPYNFPGNPHASSLAAHKKILDLATQHGREVWFDVHVSSGSPWELNDMRGPETLTQALRKICPDARFKVAVFELNAFNHTVNRMLGNAWVISELEKIGSDVPIVTSANCLQPDGQNDNGWDQGLLFLNPHMVWGQPPYYVTQMLSENYLPQVVKTDIQSPGNVLNVTSKRSEDGKTLQLQVVNIADHAVTARINLGGYVPAASDASVVEISGSLADKNTPDDPGKVVPKKREWPHKVSDGCTSYAFPPYSFTIIRFR